MPHYATLSDIPSIYDNKVTGYAVEGTAFHSGTDASFSIPYVYFALVATNFVVVGLSTPLFGTISEAISGSSGRKPKLYYHFWSTILLIFGGVWGYEIIYPIKLTNNFYYKLLFPLMISVSIYGTAAALVSDKKIKAFSVPLSECCCCAYSKKCRKIWSCVMTIIGVYFTVSLIVYLLSAAPTIVFVYYLYPTRTLNSSSIYYWSNILYYHNPVFCTLPVRNSLF